MLMIVCYVVIDQYKDMESVWHLSYLLREYSNNCITVNFTSPMTTTLITTYHVHIIV
jgi:hypothetical protein